MRTGPLYERLKFVFPKYSEGQSSPHTGVLKSRGRLSQVLFCRCVSVLLSSIQHQQLKPMRTRQEMSTKMAFDGLVSVNLAQTLETKLSAHSGCTYADRFHGAF